MKKRVLSALLVLCMACGLVSTAWAAGDQATPETADEPGIMLLNEEGTPNSTESPAPTGEEVSAETDPTATPAPSAEPTETPTATPSATPVTTPEPVLSGAAAAEPTQTAAPDETAGEAQTVAYTAALEQDGQALNVVVNAPAGAFGADVEPTLSVTAIEDEDEAKAIEAKLAENNIEYDGFAALDIQFTDADGKEIEPSAPVTVRIELPDSIIDSGIDLNTLAVQHFAEDEADNVTSVDQVASVADGTIVLSDEAKAAMEAQAADGNENADTPSNEAAGIAPMMLAPATNNALTPDNGDTAETEAPVVAEFTVSGFSTFTITWKGHDWGSITVRIVDSEGNDIAGEWNVNLGSDSFNTNQWIDINEIVSSIISDSDGQLSEYVFDHAEARNIRGSILDNEHAKDIKWIRANTGKYTDRVSEVRYSADEHVTSSNGGRKLSSIEGQTIYFVFNKKPGGGGTTDPDPENPSTSSATVTTGKSAVLNDETGNYTLNLSVSGDRGNKTQKQKANILFILDRSSSMWYDYGGSGQDADKTRMEVLQREANALVDKIAENKQIDANYSIVQFGTGSVNKVLRDWVYGTESAQTIKNIINDIKEQDDVGTNYQAGIRLAKQQLNSIPTDYASAPTYVIFITDGIPTYSYNSLTGNSETDNASGWGGSSMQTNDYALAIQEIGSMKCSNFYAIGVSSGFNEDVLDALRGVKNDYNNRGQYGDGVQATVSNTYSATETEQLQKAFEQIAQSVTFFSANNITMTDPLSDYADLVPVAEGENAGNYAVTLTLEKRADTDSEYETVGDPQTVYVAANDTNGAPASLSDGTENVSVTVYIDKDAETGKETIRVDFADNYELAQNYRYTVSTTIKPSDQAISETSLAYNGTGETNTGTHEGQNGFWSNDNDNAKVTFDAITYPEGSDNPTVTEEGQEAFFPQPVIQVEETPVELPAADPDIRKYVDDNTDGSFDLSLDVTGTTVKETKSVNVLYILDMSYSMMWDMPSVDEENGVYPYPIINNDPESNHSGDRYYFNANENGTDVDDETGLGPIPYSWYRYNVAKRAIETLNQALTNDVLDVDTQLIAFNQSAETGSWQNLSDFTLQDPVYTLFDTGTSYVDALDAANNALNVMTNDEKAQDTYVIFITDGNPNRAGLNTSTSSTAEEGIDAAKEYLDDMPGFVDGLYVIGVSDDVQKGYLDDLVTETPNGIPNSVYQTSEASALVQQFANMAAEIAGTDAHNVTIVDELSEYAELVNADVAPTISIKNASNEPVKVQTVADGYHKDNTTGVVTQTFTFLDKTTANATQAEQQTLTYTYYPAGQYDLDGDGTNDNGHPVITLTFPEAYQLTKDWTYTITVNIQPTDAAVNYEPTEEDTTNRNGYPHVGDANTDVTGATGDEIISSGKPGFHSNTEAKLTYTTNDADKDKSYPHPVITVKTGSLTIDKNIVSNETGFAVTDLGNVVFTFEVQGPDAVKGETYGSVSFDQNGIAEVTIVKDDELTITGLPAGSYTVTETGKPDSTDGSYYCSGTTYQVDAGDKKEQPQNANVQAGKTVKVTVENTYAKYRTVTITKQVEGNLTSTTKAFEFTTSIQRGEDSDAVNVNVNTVTTENSKQVITVNGEKLEVEFEQSSNQEAETAQLTTDGYQLPATAELVIHKVKDGDTIIVAETAESSEGYEVSYLKGSTTETTIPTYGVTVNADTTITVKNSKSITGPVTGLERHDTPYALMITAAGIAGLALIGSIVARRVRRRREE